MVRKYPDSRIEIWSADYINNNCVRQEQDKNVKIMQIETGTSGKQYIVEIVPEAEIEKKPRQGSSL